MLSITFATFLAAAPQAPPPPPDQAAFIAEVRQKALDYTKGLSDFLCTQVTRRSSAKVTKDPEPNWKLQDILTIRVSYFKQKEDYRVIKVNDKSVDKTMAQLSGHRTEGEFGTILNDIFSAGNEAKFEWSRWSSLDGKPTAVLGFRIEQSHSSFSTVTRRLFRQTSCHWGAIGELEVNPETRQVMKLSLRADDIPTDCGPKDIQMLVSYGYQKIGDREFLVPLQSESLVNIYGQIVKAETQFTDYRKFSAATDIKFDTSAPGEPR